MAGIPRRKAFISREAHPYECRSTVEHRKSTTQKMMRRYAITKYSQNSNFRVIKSLVQIEKKMLNHCKKPSLDNIRFIVFDVVGNLDIKYEGSATFLSLIKLYYREYYQFSESETQQSILQNTILHEFKQSRYRFVKESFLDSEKAFFLDDDQVLKHIHDRIKVEEIKTSKFRTSSQQSR